ncbi:hypothetical protein H072_5766 [Dactylellina haptotyla CBS 200.50]|uniref:RanBD1 domain-containing protein n=1 Tax=Dactylellina haptotyla (strain CBS 200.50) TaxID=1284197 RepID=S8AGZ1_DACHA|nr:hypothetical protein H072_5766 [Dactylellina haptotyla CBS 200.50]
MAKRGATEQITKDTWERDEDQGGRDRSEEPAEVASAAILAKRKILKPRSRVSAASPSIALPTPASPSPFNFGQPAAPSPAPVAAAGGGGSTGSLFGQQQPTPSKSLFGQLAQTPAAAASSAQKASSFPNLFGASTQAKEQTSASTPLAATSSLSNPFGSLATPSNSFSKPTGSIFGTPSAQTSKSTINPFAAPALAPNGTAPNISTDFGASFKKPVEQSQSIFGSPQNKPRDTAGLPGLSTTPTATPSKPSIFNMFGDAGPATGSKPKSEIPSTNLLNKTPAKPLFGASSQTVESNQKTNRDAKDGGNLFTATKSTNGNTLFRDNSALAAQKPLFTTQKAPSAAVPTPALNRSKDSVQLANASEPAKTLKVDPRSLEPPPGSNLSKEHMPAFNWLYQIRSLNSQFLDMVKEALENDPYADLSSWTDFYRKQISAFDRLRLSQREQVDSGMDLDNGNHSQPNYGDAGRWSLGTPSKASLIFESALAPSPNKSPQSQKSAQASGTPSSLFQAQSSTDLFGQQPAIQAPPTVASTASIFSSAASTKPVDLSGSKSIVSSEIKNTSSFQFGSGTQAPSSLFDSSLSKENDHLKPFSANNFGWNSKSGSAVASNASSPGSVLAGGTSGMKDADAGGWSNPFTQENPLFITKDDDDDDDEDDEEEEVVVATQGEGQSADDVAQGSTENKADPAPSTNATEPSPSIFATQPQSSNSLFGRVSSTPIFNFGQPSNQKTGAVGLFGNATSSTETKTWTPDKGIKFGHQGENKDTASSSSGPSGSSLFGIPNQGTSAGLFGSSTTNVPSFNFSQPSNGNSIFSNPSSKPATPPVLFGGQSGSGLAPPAFMFGGQSPAPSDISTPGDTSTKTEDENEPSDEAGQNGGNSNDFSGRGPGEEDEDDIFEARSSIYNLVKGSYVKIGIGRLRVLKNRNTAKSRVVVKVESGKVLMNVGLRKDLDYSKVSESEAQGKVVKVLEFLQTGESRVWVMKVGTVELAQNLRKTLEENK